MVDQNVDLLFSYLDSFPELEKNLRRSPLAVLWRDRWRAVTGVRKLSLGLEVRCAGGGTLHLVPSSSIAFSREAFQHQLLNLMENFLGSTGRVKVLDKTDRNRHQTAAILRVVLSSSEKSVAALGICENESPELPGRLLASLVIWWEGLKEIDHAAVFLPDSFSERILDWLPYLTIPIVCYKYSLELGEVRQIYPRPDLCSRIQSPYLFYPMLSEAPRVFRLLNREFPSLDVLFRHGKWELSYKGLPVAWCDDSGSILFDLCCPKRHVQLPPLREHIFRAMKYRSYPPPAADHFCFRYGEERWLESLVMRQHRRINPDFGPQIYSQVPTWVGGDRKILDLLTVTNQGRLAVMELKTQKDLNLIFQGLDYWERVEHHRSRSDFKKAGYFSGIALAELPPLLYLVCPLFEFHRMLVTIRQYLSNDFKICCVGINTDWKRGLKILRQFEL